MLFYPRSKKSREEKGSELASVSKDKEESRRRHNLGLRLVREGGKGMGERR